MSKLSQEAIKNLTKSDLKTELSKQELFLSRKKEDLGKRLTETSNEENNQSDEPKKCIENVLIYMIK